MAKDMIRVAVVGSTPDTTVIPRLVEQERPDLEIEWILRDKDMGTHDVLLNLEHHLIGHATPQQWKYRNIDLSFLTQDEIHDPRYRYTAGMWYSPKAQQAIAHQLVRVLAMLNGERRKVLVVDCDFTLWGGVLGDVGPEGIYIGGDWPGNAYQDVQRELLAWRNQGVLLAICSKNDEGPVLDVLANHPSMLIRPDDLAGWRINWHPKPQNLRELARELNVGLDSFVFLDDSPIEREWVRQELPEVAVPDLPDDVAYYPRTISRLEYFDSVGVTEADRERPDQYTAERKRRQTADGKSSGEFLASLDLRVTVRKATEYDTARVVQLTQRTNQFNLTGKQYSTADLTGRDVWICEAIDKFGDYGTIGAMLVVGRQVEQMVVSCRALGRGIEQAFLAGVSSQTATLVRPEWVDTGKNGAAKPFWDAWNPECPDWIALEVKA